MQFTPPHGRISLTLGAEGGEAVLSVQDTGAGIEPAFIPHVFEQFRQGEGGLSRKHGGLGLGLAVVKQLIELHGGSVAVTSLGTGKGATFSVRLPRETATTGRQGRRLRPASRQPQILIFSELDGESSALKSVLESSGARVSVRPLPPGGSAPSTAPDCDLIVSETAAAVTYRVPASVTPDAAWRALPSSAQPAEIVRRIAQATTLTKTS